MNSLDGQSLPKTIVHFNRVLKACVEGKEMGKIEGVLEQMNGSGAMMDEVTVKLLVNAYVSQGKLAEAVDVFEQAREEEVIGAVDPSLYDTVIGAYRQQGAFEKAMDLCDEMRWVRLPPSLPLTRLRFLLHVPPQHLTPLPPSHPPSLSILRFLRLNPTKEGYAFIATVAVKDGKTYLINRTLETMKQEGFAVSEIEYVKGIIEKELPENLKHQVNGQVVAKA